MSSSRSSGQRNSRHNRNNESRGHSSYPSQPIQHYQYSQSSGSGRHDGRGLREGELDTNMSWQQSNYEVHHRSASTGHGNYLSSHIDYNRDNRPHGTGTYYSAPPSQSYQQAPPPQSRQHAHSMRGRDDFLLPHTVSAGYRHHYRDNQQSHMQDEGLNQNRQRNYEDSVEDDYAYNNPQPTSHHVPWRRPSSSSESSDDIEVPSSGKGTSLSLSQDLFESSRDRASVFIKLKDKIMKLLEHHPLGIIRSTFWNQYQMYYMDTIRPEEFGCVKLQDVLSSVVNLYPDLLTFRDDKVILISFLEAEKDNKHSGHLSKREKKRQVDPSVRREEQKKYKDRRKKEKDERVKTSEYEESLTWKTYVETAEIPESTSSDIQEPPRTKIEKPKQKNKVAKTVVKKSKHLEKGEKEPVMNFASQMFKSAMEITRKDLKKAFEKFRAGLMKEDNPDQPEIIDVYVNLCPEMAITEVFRKFLLVVTLTQPPTLQEKKRHKRLKIDIEQFLRTCRENEMAAMLLHIAICCSDLTLKNATMKILGIPEIGTATSDSSVKKGKSERKITKEAILEALRRYIDRCVCQGPLNLTQLDMIEEKICEEFNLGRFSALGYGRYLKFLVTDPEAKQFLQETGEQLFGCGSAADYKQSSVQSRQDILDCIKQCQKFGRSQIEEIEGTVCEQYRVKELKHLGFGSIDKLINQSDEQLCGLSSVIYEASLCDKNCFSSVLRSQVGVLGHRTKESALACLHNCPLLTDLSEWSHWALVFEPEHGRLKDFIQKYGGIKTTVVEGDKKIQTDIGALEIRCGKLLKLVNNTSIEKFSQALSERDALKTIGQLVSIIVASKGIKTTPLALLSNHMKTALFSMHETEYRKTKQDESRSKVFIEDNAVAFVLECLVRLPLRICVATATQVFIEPLGQVIGNSTSKQLLWSHCKNFEEFRRIEELGFMLGINEWMKKFQQHCEIPDDTIEVIDDGTSTIKTDKEAKIHPIVVETSEESDDFEESVVEISSTESEDKASPKRTPQIYRRIVKKEKPGIKFEKKSVIAEKKSLITKIEIEDDKAMSPIVIDNSDKEMDIESKDSLKTVKEKCMAVVNDIRRDEFGIGVKLSEDGKRLMKIQQERLGRSLDRLSKDLYNKDTHFVLELLQNADDNNYCDEFLINSANIVPSVKFTVDECGVTLVNNECGFQEKDIRALCDVGRSTKGKHQYGYIGQKGIGFKSVFKITDCPEVHSNGYHVKFDVNSGPTGYILPHWIHNTGDKDMTMWTTKIFLPFKDSLRHQLQSLAARFNDIKPSLLLFLHRLKHIAIENKVDNTDLSITRKDKDNNVIEICHNNETDRWLVVQKSLDASNISIQTKSGVEVQSTEIAIAFPLKTTEQNYTPQALPPKQPVFAFLPLRSYGLRFIVQGDFDVPSSREDVDRDSPWNQWLRDELPEVFVEALEKFKVHRDFDDLEAVVYYLQFIPNEDEVMDFFRPFAAQIIQKLRARSCIPTESNNRDVVIWKLPSQTVTVRDALIRDVVTPEILQKCLDLYYVHSQVAASLNPSLMHTLGIESLSTAHLLDICQVISQSIVVDKTTDGEDTQILTVAKLLACVYRSLDEFRNNEEIFDRLKRLKVIPLSNCTYTSLIGQTVFLAPAEFTSRKETDRLSELRRELNTVHDGLINTADHEINSQVEKLLIKLGVRQLTPTDIINHHIMPVWKTDDWKNKSQDALICYLIYVKDQYEQKPDTINIDEIIEYCRLITNQGIRNPSVDSLHFTPAYKTTVNLSQDLPGCDWILLDNCYIKGCSQHKIMSWRNFLSKLGVVDFLSVKYEQREYTPEELKVSPWKDKVDLFPCISDAYVIKNYRCPEFYQLVKVNRSQSSFDKQMKILFEHLLHHWESIYSKCCTAQVFDKKGNHLIDVPSTFGIHLQSFRWIPCIQIIQKPTLPSPTQVTSISEASQLYIRSSNTESILGHMIKYLHADVSERNTFCQYLGIQNTVSVVLLQQLFCQYCETEENVCFTLQHIKSIYRYLFTNLPPFQFQQLFCDNSLIFLPEKSSSGSFNSTKTVLKGKMVSRDDVWWEDSTSLFKKYKYLLDQSHRGMNTSHVIGDIYRDMSDVFVQAIQVNTQPLLSQYCELLCVMSGALNLLDRNVVTDVLSIYAVFGTELQKGNESQSQLATFTSEKNKLLRRLKTRKLFITKKSIWIGFEDNPIISDNKEIERLFYQTGSVHFMDLEDRQQNRRKKELIQNKLAAIRSFLEFCNIPKLSELLDLEEITEVLEECPSLHLYFYRLLPIMQLYLFSNYNELYRQYVEANVSRRIQKATFWQTCRLEVKYTIKNNKDASIIRPEKCLLTSDYRFFIDKKFIMSHVDINKEIVRVFSKGDPDCNKDLRNFLSELCALLLQDSPSSKDIWEILNNHEVDDLPKEEQFWKITTPPAYRGNESQNKISAVWLPPRPAEFRKNVKEFQRQTGAVAADAESNLSCSGDVIESVTSSASPESSLRPTDTGMKSIQTVCQTSPSRSENLRYRGHIFSKRRLDSTGEDIAPAPKKTALHLGLPTWSDTASDYTFEELAKGDNLKVPENISLEKGAQTEEIGRWGEMVVFQYLLQHKNTSKDIVDILWLNEFEETGLPYDFEVIHLVNNMEVSVYIEVKSTISSNKEAFEISSHELRFAMDKRDCYHVYRIFCAGDAKNVRLIRIENLSLRLDSSEMKLCVVI